MTSRAKLRADAEVRRKQVARAEWVAQHPPLWPMVPGDWKAPEPPAKRSRGRPPNARAKVEQMMEARAVLFRRYVKKAVTARAAAPKAAAARRQIGDRLRKRVLAMVERLGTEKVPARKMASRIAADLELAGLRIDPKRVREILKTAGSRPAK